LLCYTIGQTLCLSPEFEIYTLCLLSCNNVIWCNILGLSPDSVKVLLIQKSVIRTMIGGGRRDSCRTLLQELGILTLPSQYIFCILLFVVKNSKLFSVNKDLHLINTRQQSNLHQPLAHLQKYQLGPYNMGIKLFNILPASIKDESHNPPRFRSPLKKLLLETTLYSLDEFFSIRKSMKS